jgi:hypothetical protein
VIEIVKANAKPIGAVAALIGMYVLARWFPGLEKERELLITITEVLNLLGVVAVPAFARVQHK